MKIEVQDQKLQVLGPYEIKSNGVKFRDGLISLPLDVTSSLFVSNCPDLVTEYELLGHFN